VFWQPGAPTAAQSPRDVVGSWSMLPVIAWGVAGSFVVLLNWWPTGDPPWAEKPGPGALQLREVDMTVGITPGPIYRLYLFGPTWWGIEVWVAITVSLRRRGRRLRSWVIVLATAVMVTLLRIVIALA